MRITAFLLILAFALTGCANPAENIDIKNSPCACNYDGIQLITAPTDEQLKKIADLQFS